MSIGKVVAVCLSSPGFALNLMRLTSLADKDKNDDDDDENFVSMRQQVEIKQL